MLIFELLHNDAIFFRYILFIVFKSIISKVNVSKYICLFFWKSGTKFTEGQSEEITDSTEVCKAKPVLSSGVPGLYSLAVSFYRVLPQTSQCHSTLCLLCLLLQLLTATSDLSRLLAYLCCQLPRVGDGAFCLWSLHLQVWCMAQIISFPRSLLKCHIWGLN